MSDNQCSSRNAGSRCHKLSDHTGEHHDVITGRRWEPPHPAVSPIAEYRRMLRDIVEGCVEERPGFRTVSYTLIDEARRLLESE